MFQKTRKAKVVFSIYEICLLTVLPKEFQRILAFTPQEREVLRCYKNTTYMENTQPISTFPWMNSF